VIFLVTNSSQDSLANSTLFQCDPKGCNHSFSEVSNATSKSGVNYSSFALQMVRAVMFRDLMVYLEPMASHHDMYMDVLGLEDR